MDAKSKQSGIDFPRIYRYHSLVIVIFPGGKTIMPTTFDYLAFDRATDPIMSFFTVDQAEALIAYRGDAEIQEKIEQLAEKCSAGTLTDSERAEYEGYVRANKFIATLQSKARKLLKK
jgi:hypothetical protein